MEKAPKLSLSEYEKNFDEITPAFSKNSAVLEANRCLYCYDSPCIKACPTHIDIPTFIKKISTDNLIGSAKTILESNWVALTCAKACPVEELCEGACVYNEKGEQPIQIGRLQRYSIDHYFENNMPELFEQKESNGKSVGIIGSGPAGLACAAELSLLGYKAVVYESNEIPGGLNSWGIAPYKSRQADSLKEVALVESFGAEIKTGITVGEDISFDEIFRKHDAIFIGIGLGNSQSLNIPGENLVGVVDAITFIEDVKQEVWTNVDVGKKVAVIGAGNTAIDAATEAKRLGAEKVMIIYRRSEKEMPANDYEYELAKQDGIVFHFLTSPIEIMGEDSVTGLKSLKMELGKEDEKGRRVPIPIADSEFEIPVDMVISALGQKVKKHFVESINDLQIENKLILVDKETFQTTNKRVFAGGDCINGGKEVVNAAYDGKRAAHGIDSYIKSL